MLDADLMDAIARRPPIWGAGSGDWWDFTRSGRAKRGVGAMPVETRASDGWVENEAGLLVKRSANTRSMAGKGLLTYPTRTNLLTYSEQFDNAAWSKGSVTVTANTVASPDGTTTADKIVETADTSTHNIYQTRTIVTATVYTHSIYAKAAERSWVCLEGGGGAGSYSVWFNLSTGTVGTIISTAAGNVSIVALPNGWYRCIVADTTTGTSGTYRHYICDADNNQSYTGDGTSGLYLWGAQLEMGSFASPPIVTTGLALTANGPQQVIDIGSRAALGFGFALQVDLRGLATSSCSVFDVNDGSVSNRFTIYSLSGNFRHALGKAGIYDVSEPIIAAASTGLATFYGAVGPGYRNVRMVGQADPGADLSTDYPSTLSRVSPLGQGYSAANNSFGYAKRLALWYGPMSAYFMDNVIGPRAQIMQQQAA